MADWYEKIYNQEIKERYLTSIDINQYPPRWWERVFEKSYILEQTKDKDLYSFTVPEILEFYKFLDVGTLAPLTIYNTNLIKYAQWALNENLIHDGQNHFDGLDNELLVTCVNTVKTKQSILSYDTFMKIIRQGIINEQDKFVFFCLFEGIKGKDYQDIVDMNISDIDKKNLEVHLGGGRTVSVPQDFIDIAELADKQMVYYGLTEKTMEIKLIPSDKIYKEKNNSQGKDINRSVYVTVVRNIANLDDLHDVVTAKSLRDSGLIYYLNRRADKLHTTVEELFYTTPEDIQDIIEKYRFNMDIRKRWILQYKEFLH